MSHRNQARRRILVASLLVVTMMTGIGRFASPEAISPTDASVPHASQQPVGTTYKPAEDSAIDARARATEQQMTDDERR